MADDDESDGMEEIGSDQDPISGIQSVLGEIDPEAMVASFVCIVEWLEPDGTSSLSLLHTPMPPWHRQGLLHYAQNYDASTPILIDLDGDEDWDE